MKQFANGGLIAPKENGGFIPPRENNKARICAAPGQVVVTLAQFNTLGPDLIRQLCGCKNAEIIVVEKDSSLFTEPLF